MTTEHPHQNTVMENIHDAIEGVDEPMENAHSTASGVMIAGMYPILLLLLTLGALAVMGIASCVR